jgi:hypothetical protein
MKSRFDPVISQRTFPGFALGRRVLTEVPMSTELHRRRRARLSERSPPLLSEQTDEQS